MNFLRLGLASIKKRDSSRFRRRLFSQLRSENFLLEVAHRGFASRYFNAPVSYALVLFSMRRFFQIRENFSESSREVSVFHYSNEKRAIEKLARDSPDSISYGFQISRVPLFAFKGFSFRKCFQWLRVSRGLLKKNGFLVGARQAEFILLYGYFCKLLQRKQIRGKKFCSSSESNPEVISALLAAKKMGNKTVFVNHSALESEQGIFFHDEVLIQPTEVKQLMTPNFSQVKRVGIACSVVSDGEKMRKAVQDCLDTFPNAEVVVRQHPNPTFKEISRAALPKSERLRVSSRRHSLPFSSEAGDWDFAIAGNSSAHLDLMGFGVPTVHMNIDGIDWDPYDFIGSGLVPSVEHACDIPKKMTAHKRYSKVDF